jgi:chromosome segregation ATPase
MASTKAELQNLQLEVARLQEQFLLETTRLDKDVKAIQESATYMGSDIKNLYKVMTKLESRLEKEVHGIKDKLEEVLESYATLDKRLALLENEKANTPSPSTNIVAPPKELFLALEKGIQELGNTVIAIERGLEAKEVEAADLDKEIKAAARNVEALDESLGKSQEKMNLLDKEVSHLQKEMANIYDIVGKMDKHLGLFYTKLEVFLEKSSKKIPKRF